MVLAFLTITVTALGSIASMADPIAFITVDPSAIKSTDRLAVLVSGTYTCGPLDPEASDVFAGVELTQASGREINRGFGTIENPICDGQPQEFESLVTPYYYSGSPWHGGSARAEGFLDIFIFDPCCEDLRASSNSQVKIRGGGKF
jgi:hypothetical protein